MSSAKKIRIPVGLSLSDRLVEMIVLMILLTHWVYVIDSFPELPEIIPVHFNVFGQVDAFGSRYTIWIMPALSALLSGGLSWLNKYPHSFNYLIPVTVENARRQYILATRMMRYLKLGIVVLFGAISIDTVQIANDTESVIAGWLMLLILAGNILPVPVYIYYALKVR